MEREGGDFLRTEMSGRILPIVALAQCPPQLLCETPALRVDVLAPTEELQRWNECGEQPQRRSDNLALDQHEQPITFPSTQPRTSSTESTSIITDNSTTHPKEVPGRNAMASPPSLLGAAGTTTNRRENSRAGKQLLKPAEDRLPLHTTDKGFTARHRDHQDTQAHFSTSTTTTTSSNSLLATLPHNAPHHIPPHAVTPAEIALSISPSFSRPDRRQQQSMPHDSRTALRADYSTQESSKKEASVSSVSELPTEDKDAEEENTSRTSDTLLVPPGRSTPLHDSSEHEASELSRLGGSEIRTPSTVSTDPSTDDASLVPDYKLDASFCGALLQGTPDHSSDHSWGEEVLLPGAPGSPLRPDYKDERGPWRGQGGVPLLPQRHWADQHFAQPNQQQQRVASFRDTPHYSEGSWSQHSQQYSNHHQHRQRMHTSEEPMQFQGQGGHAMSVDVRHGHSHTPQQFSGYQQQSMRKPYSGSGHTSTPPVATPPRPRNARQQGLSGHSLHRTPHGGNPGGNPHPPGSSAQRSSSEILKTLLRKKACLYEPDTSRSVALVTWLVGRELALAHGFFSRQQLQAGVHACVSNKIDSGTITRTKVNRCMQIILNSCFHYIIPRSDGSEEKGDSFRVMFARTVKDDSFLLQYLPAPWNDLEVQREVILEASFAEYTEESHPPANVSTPKSSPKVKSANATSSPGKEGDDGESKRAVLLCFNENVRSAEDVFRCHNEFIRDTANAANLQLTAHDWRSFFGREAARAPYLWGNIGIPIPSSEAKGGASRPHDAFGQMSDDEAAKFRTSWCSKRYDHDHELCGFAHVEVNGGWLRRNPSLHSYNDEMCKFVTKVNDELISSGPFFMNECPDGVHCGFAHSSEEIMYHPIRYKRSTCNATRSGGCHLGDVCPHVHPVDISKHTKKSGESRSLPGPRHQKKSEQSNVSAKTIVGIPAGSPVVYASPAPFSEFERQLAMPGLKSLFRSHSAVVSTHVRSGGKNTCVYSIFGDN